MDERAQLKEVIRQKRELVKFMELDLQGVKQSLDKSVERYISLLEESPRCKCKSKK